ncbi:MAG TPA: hypothetical protein VN240_07700 [Propylenella sp.]|nr:hypothetical protein [Propylenella sp.]
MISFFIDAVLLAALILTSIRVGRMYRELRRLRRLQDEYRSVLDQTGSMLTCVQDTVREIKEQGGELLYSLGTRLDEARIVLAELDDRLQVFRWDANRAAPTRCEAGSVGEMSRAA